MAEGVVVEGERRRRFRHRRPCRRFRHLLCHRFRHRQLCHPFRHPWWYLWSRQRQLLCHHQ